MGSKKFAEESIMENKGYILFPFLFGLAYSVSVFSIWWIFRLGRYLPDVLDNLIVISANLAPIAGGIVSFYRLCKEREQN